MPVRRLWPRSRYLRVPMGVHSGIGPVNRFLYSDRSPGEGGVGDEHEHEHEHVGWGWGWGSGQEQQS